MTAPADRAASGADLEALRDTLIDCMTSEGIHGGNAAAAADLILSPKSGLTVGAAEPTRPDLRTGRPTHSDPGPPFDGYVRGEERPGWDEL